MFSFLFFYSLFSFQGIGRHLGTAVLEGRNTEDMKSALRLGFKVDKYFELTGAKGMNVGKAFARHGLPCTISSVGRAPDS
jgi:hypothetical protein